MNRSLFQSKIVYGRPTKRDGEEFDMRVFEQNGSYYLAIKIKGQWKYFKETV